MTALDQYLVKKRETTTAFAARIGCDKATISRIRRGIQVPSLILARKIISGTAGKLTYGDLLRRVSTEAQATRRLVPRTHRHARNG